MDLGPPELLIIAIIILVLFGGTQIPKLARNLGNARAEFSKGLADASPAATPSQQAEPTAPSSNEPNSTSAG